MAKRTIVTQGYTFITDDLSILGAPLPTTVPPPSSRPKITVVDNTGYKQQFDDLRQLGGADGRF